MRRPIHGMAAILHPFYKTPELFGDIPLLTLRSEYLNLMLSEDDQLVIDGEMSSFMNNLGPTYLRSVATRSEATRFPLSWWQNYERQGLPQLCKLALRVLSQISQLAENHFITWATLSQQFCEAFRPRDFQERVLDELANLMLQPKETFAELMTRTKALVAKLPQQPGAQLICYPGAFNMTTGPLHWELLTRARAADNQLYVITCSPARDISSDKSYKAWGHSTVADPFGEILATTGHEEAVVFADIDYSVIGEKRISPKTAKEMQLSLCQPEHQQQRKAY
ncbi:hypothetical protein L7F22_046320 [Adiantum nelumboides]|nr:hypothetical protein [Adiantum nelumboides]